MHDLEIECIDLLLGEEEDALGDAEYLVGGEGALQPQVLHHALTGLQYSLVRAEIVTHSFSFIPGIFQKSHLHSREMLKSLFRDELHNAVSWAPSTLLADPPHPR